MRTLKGSNKLSCTAITEKTHTVMHLFVSILCKPFEEGYFPSKVFDDLHTAKKLLKEFGSFIRPHHALASKSEHLFHRHGLNGSNEDKERISSKCTWPQVGQKNYQLFCK